MQPNSTRRNNCTEARAQQYRQAKPVAREQAGYALNFAGLDGLVNLLAH